jgi:hypothetical protein
MRKVFFIVLLIGVCMCFSWGGDYTLAPLGFATIVVGIVMFVTKEKETRDKYIQWVKKHLEECMTTHFDTLWIKYKQSVYKDDYGKYEFADWYKEREYFLTLCSIIYSIFMIII